MNLRPMGTLLAAYYIYLSIKGYVKIFKRYNRDQKVGSGYVMLVLIISILSTYYFVKNCLILYDDYNL